MADAARLADRALCRPVSLVRLAGAVHARGGVDRPRPCWAVRQLGSDLWRPAGGSDPRRAVYGLPRCGLGFGTGRHLARRTEAGIGPALEPTVRAVQFALPHPEVITLLPTPSRRHFGETA